MKPRNVGHGLLTRRKSLIYNGDAIGYPDFVRFRTTAVALFVGIAVISHLPGQTARRASAETIAEELATMYMLESFGGPLHQTTLLTRHYREPVFDARTLILLHLASKSDPELYLKNGDMTFKAEVNAGSWETRVMMTSMLHGASSNIEDSQSTIERLELSSNTAFDSEAAKRIVRLERELGNSPLVRSLLENRIKVRDAVLGVLTSKPELVKPFLERKPLSAEITKSRQQMRTILNVARKEPR